MLSILIAAFSEGIKHRRIKMTFYDGLDEVIIEEDGLPILSEEAFREMIIQKLEIAVQQAAEGAFYVLLRFYNQDIAVNQL